MNSNLGGPSRQGMGDFFSMKSITVPRGKILTETTHDEEGDDAEMNRHFQLKA